ncbi:MAG: FecR family protein [Myxococcales bacterium]|nr:FecR family protein [Myxococcales bacterium]
MTDFDFDSDLRRLARADLPDEDDMAAMSRRLRRDLALQAPRSRRRRWMAVAAALIVGVLGALAWSWSAPPASEAWALQQGESHAGSGVSLLSEGTGTATVQSDTTHVQWREGRLRAELAPEAEHTLTIETPSAIVRVVGTVFTVEHSTFGTVVEVARGEVEVGCKDGLSERVRPGREAWCFRDTAWGLGRVLWLERHDAPAEERLRVIRRALAHPEGLKATRHVLREREVGALTELGRQPEALVAARALPLELRVPQLATQAGAALDRGGCPAAEPWLEALLDADDVAGGLLYVQCLADVDGARAWQALQRVWHLHPTGSDADAARAWQRALAENADIQR